LISKSKVPGLKGTEVVKLAFPKWVGLGHGQKKSQDQVERETGQL